MPRRRSPDGAPAAAQRRGGTTLTPTSGNPPSGGEEGPEPKTPNPAGAAQQTPYTPAPATVALSQEAVCCDHRQNPPFPLRDGLGRDVIPCREATAGSAHQVKGLGRSGPRHQEITMPKYLLLKHYRGGPEPHRRVPPMDQWAPQDLEAHLAFMRHVTEPLEENGEYVGVQALVDDRRRVPRTRGRARGVRLLQARPGRPAPVR